MGARHPENIPVSEWREAYPTIAAMTRGAWAVTGLCPDCKLRATVRLKLIAAVLGGEAMLWGRTLACPRWRCRGRMRIEGQPPQIAARLPTRWLDVSRGW